MLSLFDYLYISIFKLYDKTTDSSPEFAASCAVSAIQSFNVISVVILYNLLFIGERLPPSSFFIILIFLIIISLNYIRYIRIEKFSHLNIQKKLENKTPLVRCLLGYFQLIYVIISLAFYIGLMFY